MAAGRRRDRRLGRAVALAVACWLALAMAGGTSPAQGQTRGQSNAPIDRRAIPADDATFRPTVIVRKGRSQGSGSVIASVHGETLVLTVAHVVEDPGEAVIEVHRYNVGAERRSGPGPWPRVLPAEVVATDAASDLAILRVRGTMALPYVARLASVDGEDPPSGTRVTSLGIDLATKLSSWNTRVVGIVRADLKSKGIERPFLITDRGPEHGRSGGGLFLGDGRLVGVCVGRVEKSKDQWIGVFSTVENAHRLIRRAHLEAAIARSERWHVAARRKAPTAPGGGQTPLTETRHRPSSPAPGPPPASAAARPR